MDKKDFNKMISFENLKVPEFTETGSRQKTKLFLEIVKTTIDRMFNKNRVGKEYRKNTRECSIKKIQKLEKILEKRA